MMVAGVGSRSTPLDVLKDMRFIGEKIRDAGGWIRSGGAMGADRAFEEGARSRCIVYLPWPQNGEAARFHRMTEAKCFLFDDADQEAKDRARRSVYLYHPAPEALKFAGRRLHSRNYFQVMGTNEQRVDAVVCWTRIIGDKPQGGTAQAIRIARAHDIPVYNMAVKAWRDPRSILEKLGVAYKDPS